MATESEASKARANSTFRAPIDQHEKGSAMSLIADEAKATADKTARLRRLREERQSAELAQAPKPAPKAAKKPARKKAAAQV